MDNFNPYATPEVSVSASQRASEADEGRGVWRDGKILVMVKIARLPSRCAKCNAPATFWLKRSLAWHNQMLYLMIIFPGLLFYAIVAMIVQQKAKIEVPFCDEHWNRRSKSLFNAWLALLAGTAFCFAPVYAVAIGPGFGTDVMIKVMVAIGVVLLIGGLAFGLIRSQVVTPQKIDKTHVWLKGFVPAYLAELPPLPGSADWEAQAKPKPLVEFDDF